MEYLLCYLLIINALAFLLMYADKRKARKNQWRIPERVLFASALLGGSIGAMAGMQMFRHKTKHPKFFVGLPVMLVAQIILLMVLYVRLWQ